MGRLVEDPPAGNAMSKSETADSQARLKSNTITSSDRKFIISLAKAEAEKP
jgi:hypothetical protein